MAADLYPEHRRFTGTAADLTDQQRARAARYIHRHALDPGDAALLLDILGLDRRPQ